MLSETSCRPAISSSMRASMALRLCASRSSSSPVPVDRQALREVAGHDRLRRVAHRVDAAQHAPGDEQAAERADER